MKFAKIFRFPVAGVVAEGQSRALQSLPRTLPPRDQRPRLQGRLVSSTGSKTAGAWQQRPYNFSNSASCFDSVTGALQVKFSHT
jgi:Tfp pilus assembly protein PilN